MDAQLTTMSKQRAQENNVKIKNQSYQSRSHRKCPPGRRLLLIIPRRVTYLIPVLCLYEVGTGEFW